MPETSIAINITFTGNQTRTSLQLSFSTETLPHRANKTTTRVLIKFCTVNGRINITYGLIEIFNHHLSFSQSKNSNRN